jgi:predicted DNA-binding transcriptional regulator YafY
MRDHHFDKTAVAMNRTDRLYAIVEQLRSAAPRPKTVAQLAEHFEITERTIHRDLLALQEAGVPLWSQPGPGGGYFLDPAMTLPPINLTTNEALAIAVALVHSESHPFAASAQTALAKITVALQRDNAYEVRRIASRIRSVSNPKTYDVRSILEQAIALERAVLIGYGDRVGEVSERIVEPHSFVSGRGTWYLLGWCRLREAGRGFRIDRIHSATLLDEKVCPRDFADVAGDLVGIATVPDVLRGLLAADDSPAPKRNTKTKTRKP